MVLLSCTCGGNRADQGEGGAIYLSHFAAVIVEGDSNNFTNNYSGGGGGVMGATANTTISVFGGYFSGNFGGEVCVCVFADEQFSRSRGVWFVREGYDTVRGVCEDAVSLAVENETVKLDMCRKAETVELYFSPRQKDLYMCLRICIRLGVCWQESLFTPNIAPANQLLSFPFFRYAYARQYGGAFLSRGDIAISGGLFAGNEGYIRGGVFYVADNSTATLTGGTFRGNVGGTHGGVGYAAAMATVVVEGGNFSGNVAEVGGGAFYIEDSASFSVRIGTGMIAECGGYEGVGARGATMMHMIWSVMYMSRHTYPPVVMYSVLHYGRRLGPNLIYQYITRCMNIVVFDVYSYSEQSGCKCAGDRPPLNKAFQERRHSFL